MNKSEINDVLPGTSLVEKSGNTSTILQKNTCQIVAAPLVHTPPNHRVSEEHLEPPPHKKTKSRQSMVKRRRMQEDEEGTEKEQMSPADSKQTRKRKTLEQPNDNLDEIGNGDNGESGEEDEKDTDVVSPSPPASSDEEYGKHRRRTRRSITSRSPARANGVPTRSRTTRRSKGANVDQNTVTAKVLRFGRGWAKGKDVVIRTAIGNMESHEADQGIQKAAAENDLGNEFSENEENPVNNSDGDDRDDYEARRLKNIEANNRSEGKARYIHRYR